MEESNYIFRYQLDFSKAQGAAGTDCPTEMISAQLKNLLSLIIPCAGEEEVKVDGFKPLSNKTVIYKLSEDSARDCPAGVDVLPKECPPPEAPAEKPALGGSSYQNVNNTALYEPRIELIKKQLESILALVDLESEGKVVKIDGFRLKKLDNWVMPSDCDPTEIFEYAGTRCNCDCVFCYNKGTPPSLVLSSPRRTPAEEFEEIKTRLKYFNPAAKRSLFPSLGSTCEVLTHPYIRQSLELLRKKTGRTFRIATNGAALTPEMIGALAKLAPVYLDISLNSASSDRRGKLMRDRRPEVAIEALPLLKEAGIPYSIVIVPWPLETEKEMLDDLDSTVAYAAEHDVHLVQISLPGYTKYFSTGDIFDRESIWSAVVAKVQGLRNKYTCPIVIMPGMYEESLTRQSKNVPEVIGVVKNSPAALGGVQRGDIIKRVGGLVIQNRPQAREILSIFQQGQNQLTTITVFRENKEVQLDLRLDNYSYPYTKATGIHLGIIFMGTGLRVGYLERLKDIIRARQAKNVLFLSSRLVKPVFEQLLRESYYLNNVHLEIAVPENSFLGGNIIMGDLLVVDDFISCIKEHTRDKNKQFDLVVIPSSPFNLSLWGRDLTGRCYLDIERETGIPVELLECATIYD